MAIDLRSVAVAGGLLTAMAAAEPALAQKPGGILRLSRFDSPASMSILRGVDGRGAAAGNGRVQ